MKKFNTLVKIVIPNMLSENEQSQELKRFLQFFKTHYRTLMIYTFTGAFLALVLTYFIPKEYKAYAIVFPPSSTSIENSIEFPNFGYDLEADRLIQLLASTEIRDSLIQEFNLVEVFQIDTKREDWLEQLSKKYYKNILFERNPSMSVIISARTGDAKRSADMVNAIIRICDRIRQRLYKSNIIKAYELAQKDYLSQKARVDSAAAQLSAQLKNQKLSTLLMLMPEAQLNFDMSKLNLPELDQEGRALGPELIAYKSMSDLMKEYKNRFIRVKKSYDNPIPALFVINRAEPNYKKVFPSYSLNAVLAALFALIVSGSVLLLRNSLAKS